MPQQPSSADLAKQYGGTDVSALAAQFGGTAVEDPVSTSKPASGGDAIGSAIEFVKGLGSEINPIPMIGGILQVLGSGPTAGDAAVRMGAQMAQPQVDQFIKAKESWDKGDHLKAAAHTIAGLVPLIGPQAADITEEIAGGQVAHGLGRVTGLAGTIAAPEMAGAAMRGARAAGLPAKAAAMAEAGSKARIVDVLAPKGRSATVLRLGGIAEKVAPRLAEEPGMGAATKHTWFGKIKDRLTAAEEAKDAANDARGAGQIVDTSMVESGLEDKLRTLTAMPAEGAAANAQAEAMGLKPAIPAKAPIRPFGELTSAYKAQMRRVLAEMEEFGYVEPQQEFLANKPGRSDVGRTPAEASRNRLAELESSSERTFEAGTPGAPVYHDITKGSTRGAVIDALRRYIEEPKRPPTTLVQRALEVAHERITSPSTATKSMLPLDKFLEDEAAGPMGLSSIPPGNVARAKQIMAALKQLRQLGQAAPYEELVKIRQAYDRVAKPVYAPAVTPDYLKVAGAAEGAADVAGTFREVLSFADEKTAAANKEYSFWKNADTVASATAELERSRPKTGRLIMTRLATTIGGSAMHGSLGGVIGFLLGPIVDGVINAGPTTKILTARMLSDLSKSLKTGNVTGVERALKAARAISLSLPKPTAQEAK